MKIRSDFVSNSSSCSFIIKDIKNICNLFGIILKDIEIPYGFEENIDITIYCKCKNYLKLYELINGHKLSNVFIKDYMVNIDCAEDLCWDNFTVELIDLKNILTTKNIELIDEIKFNGDDFTDAPVKLRLLYNFFKKYNCNPDASESEKSFLNTNPNDFLNIIMNANYIA